MGRMTAKDFSPKLLELYDSKPEVRLAFAALEVSVSPRYLVGARGLDRPPAWCAPFV